MTAVMRSMTKIELKDGSTVEAVLREKATEFLNDSERKLALRNLLAYADDEIEADDYISRCSGEDPLPGGDDYLEQMQALANKIEFVSMLYGGRLGKLAACNHPDAKEDEKSYYDYWYMLSAATQFGWG